MSDAPSLGARTIQDADPCPCGAYCCSTHVRPGLAKQLLAWQEKVMVGGSPVRISNDTILRALKTLTAFHNGQIRIPDPNAGT